MRSTVELPDGPIEIDDARWSELTADIDHRKPLPRLAYAAAHVVMDSSYQRIQHSVDRPGSAEEIAEHVDWDATMQLRTVIGREGFGIAEAMDTAQRFNLGWNAARELIERTGKLGLSAGFCAGASTDHLPQVTTTNDLVHGVTEQIQVIRSAGGVPVILPMPLLCELKLGASAFTDVYGEIIRNAGDGPLVIHWLGPMFLPALEGYFPGDSFQQIMRIDPTRVRAAKLSMLDHALEVELRRDLLERDQIMMTGDDFHFGALIAGESNDITSTDRTTELDGRKVDLGDFSHALLGILDAIASPAALAMRHLDNGNRSAYDTIMNPCEKLGQVIFEAPTRHYKTGLAFLAWINGIQDNPMLVNHEESCRTPEHLCRVVRLANDAGAIGNAPLATERLAGWAADL